MRGQQLSFPEGFGKIQVGRVQHHRGHGRDTAVN